MISDTSEPYPLTTLALSLRVADVTFRIGRFGRSCLGQHAAGTLASVILLASLTKTRQHCDADEILQKAIKATIKNTYIFLRKLGKVVIYNIMTVGFCLSSINQLLIIQENSPLKSSPNLLPPIHFIRVLNINKNKPVKDQLKVIREDILYILNKVY